MDGLAKTKTPRTQQRRGIFVYAKKGLFNFNLHHIIGLRKRAAIRIGSYLVQLDKMPKNREWKCGAHSG